MRQQQLRHRTNREIRQNRGFNPSQSRHTARTSIMRIQPLGFRGSELRASGLGRRDGLR